MTKNIAQQFVCLRLIGLASERAAELALNHAECRLNITALMIVLLKPFLIVSVEVIEARPRRVFGIGLARLLEINVGRGRGVSLKGSGWIQKDRQLRVRRS